MAGYIKFLSFSEKLITGDHDWNTHTYKLALTNTAPTTDQVSFNLASHPTPTAAAGYPAVSNGGAQLTLTVARSVGTTTVSADQVVFTATAGGIGPFRYAILYNATNNFLVAYWDYATSITLQEGETFTVKFNNTHPAGLILSLT